MMSECNIKLLYFELISFKFWTLILQIEESNILESNITHTSSYQTLGSNILDVGH